jgi:hypothetical protein
MDQYCLVVASHLSGVEEGILDLARRLCWITIHMQAPVRNNSNLFPNLFGWIVDERLRRQYPLLLRASRLRWAP